MTGIDTAMRNVNSEASFARRERRALDASSSQCLWASVRTSSTLAADIGYCTSIRGRWRSRLMLEMRQRIRARITPGTIRKNASAAP